MKNSETFISKRELAASLVKQENERLYNALNVVIERTEHSNLIPNWEVIYSCIPFVNLRSSHIGYAETENINDIHDCWSQVQDALFLISTLDGYVYPDMYDGNKFMVKQNLERFKQNNANFQGRILARFNYLLNKKHEVSSL
tara:strand:- start:658 stop:1083 length:426 start_codon:yes stop_codon:yes gene_type:complete